MTENTVNSDYVCDFLDRFSLTLLKETFVVLDNASLHKSKKFKARKLEWENRGLYIFYLPTYSPHLNIAETLWRKLKKEWLRPQDYETSEKLTYSLTQCLMSMGRDIGIIFSDFRIV